VQTEPQSTNQASHASGYLSQRTHALGPNGLQFSEVNLEACDTICLIKFTLSLWTLVSGWQLFQTVIQKIFNHLFWLSTNHLGDIRIIDE
jgi:hypothetical protein